MKTLETFSSSSTTLNFRGEELHLSPLRLQQISPVIAASRTIIGRVAMIVGVLEDVPASAAGAILLDLLEQDSTDLAAALAVAICPEPEWIPGPGLEEALRQKAAWIGGGTLDEVANLLSAVVALNREFFTFRMGNLLRKAKVPAEENADSATSSSS